MPETLQPYEIRAELANGELDHLSSLEMLEVILKNVFTLEINGEKLYHGQEFCECLGIRNEHTANYLNRILNGEFIYMQKHIDSRTNYRCWFLTYLGLIQFLMFSNREQAEKIKYGFAEMTAETLIKRML